VDVTAEEALDGGLGGFGCCGWFGGVGHAGSPFVFLCAKSTKVFKKGMLSLDFFGLGLD
jgi:hypothetical protein